MNITQENLPGNEANINVHITADDYRESYKQELKKYAKQVPMKGFRPGTVPLHLVQKMAGPSLLLDQLNKIVGQSLENYLKENNIEILGDPMPEALDDFNPDFDNLPEFKFTYNVGFSPRFEFTVPSVVMDDYQITVTDEDLEDSIMRTRMRQPKYVTSDVVGEKSLIKCDIVEGGAPTNSGFAPSGSTSILIHYWKSAEEQAKFYGKKVGDIVAYNAFAATEGNLAEMSNLLGVTRDEATDYTHDVQVLITEISTEHPADMNSDFFETVYPGREIATEEQFREAVKNELSSIFNEDSRQHFYHQLDHVLMDSYSLEMPEAFLKRWIKSVNTKTISDEQLDKEFPSYINHMKLRLIHNRIFAINNFEISNDEIQDAALAELQSIMRNYGMNTYMDMSGYVPKYLEKRENLQKAIERVQEFKVNNFLYNQIAKNSKSVTYKEFGAIVEDHHKQHHAQHEHEHAH